MRINGNTKIFGILGDPVGHSLSPLLHNFIIEYYNLDAVYVPLRLRKGNLNKKSLKNILQNLSIEGLSVTIPHKKLIYEIADQRDDLSSVTLASNTFIREELNNNVILKAFNTDGPGAAQSLLMKTNLNKKNILIIGYGGSASAIAGELLLKYQPNKLIITGRNKKKGQQFTEILNQKIKHFSLCKFFPTEELIKSKDINYSEMEIIINTTPLGMKNYEDDLPIPEELILKNQIIMDIVYNPLETHFLKIAKNKRATIIEGYWMLLFQAIRQMEIFYKIKIEKDLIPKLKNILLKNLK